jgi:hypothetical protein
MGFWAHLEGHWRTLYAGFWAHLEGHWLRIHRNGKYFEHTLWRIMKPTYFFRKFYCKWGNYEHRIERTRSTCRAHACWNWCIFTEWTVNDDGLRVTFSSICPPPPYILWHLLTFPSSAVLPGFSSDEGCRPLAAVSGLNIKFMSIMRQPLQIGSHLRQVRVRSRSALWHTGPQIESSSGSGQGACSELKAFQPCACSFESLWCPGIRRYCWRCGGVYWANRVRAASALSRVKLAY